VQPAKRIWIYILITLFFLGICLGILFLRKSSTIGENPTIVPTQSIRETPTKQEIFSCEGDLEYKSGNYKILNNVWNKRVLRADETYEQCIRVKSLENPLNVNAGWNWSWPNGNIEVKAYPEIIYGWAPWLSNSTDVHLPVQLSKLGGFKASYDTVVSSQGGSHNTAFDLWITSAVPPTPSNRTAEIMIWVDRQNWPVDLSSSTSNGRILIDEHEYDYSIYIRPKSWTYIRFISVDPQPKGSITIDHFLNFLLEKGYISAGEFLADIEFGNEIRFGTGQTIIRSYSVTPSD
jgi:hypothetical protein